MGVASPVWHDGRRTSEQREAMQMAAKPNPFVRGWKYMGAWFGAKIDEKADPKIQIEQAIQEAQRQHQALTTQAAAVIGNQRQLEMQLDRQLNTVENLQSQARQALLLADKARAEGDDTKAAAVRADRRRPGEPARQRRVSRSRTSRRCTTRRCRPPGRPARRCRPTPRCCSRGWPSAPSCCRQLEQAKMQESVATSLQQMSDLAAPSNVPSLEEVRDKIERRYAVALGQAELAKDSTGSRVLEVQRATMDMKGAARLDEIRASLAAETKPAVTSGGGAAAIENAEAERAVGRHDEEGEEGPAQLEPGLAGRAPVGRPRPRRRALLGALDRRPAAQARLARPLVHPVARDRGRCTRSCSARGGRGWPAAAAATSAPAGPGRRPRPTASTD